MSEAKVCIITGATSGIGKAAALSLAKKGAHLLLVSRSVEKGKGLQHEIDSIRTNSKAELYVADLSSQAEIRRLAEEIRKRHAVINILLNNAGGIFGTRRITADGLEHTFALNHLAYFHLTNLLLDRLKASESARVVNVTSQMHRYTAIDFDDLGLEKKYSPMKSYAQSKLANLLFTYELARRLSGTRVTVNAYHPGGVRSNFGRELPGTAGFFFRHLGFLLRSPEKGAETAVWLASAPELEGVTGKYFLDKREIRSSAISYDQLAARRLWDISARSVGFPPE
jgi:retinol dehydrogenase-14